MPLFDRMIAGMLSQKANGKSVKTVLDNIVDEELRSELEELGFQVKVSNIWYRFSGGVVSMFSIRKAAIEMDIYPMFCEFEYSPYPNSPTFNLGLFGGRPGGVPTYVVKEINRAKTQFEILYGTDEEKQAEQFLRSSIREYWERYIKRCFAQVADIPSAIRFLDETSAAHAQMLLNSSEYLARGGTTDPDVLAYEYVHYRNSCGKSYQIECAVMDRFEEGERWARRLLSKSPNKAKYQESLDVFQQRNKDICYANARDIFQRNIEVIKTRFPKKKMEQLPVMADLDRYLF